MLDIILTQVFIFAAFWLDAHRDAWPASSHFHTYKVFSLAFFIGAGFAAPDLWVISVGIFWGSILWDLVYRWRRYGNAFAGSPFFITFPGFEFRFIKKLGGNSLLWWGLIRCALGVVAMWLRWLK